MTINPVLAIPDNSPDILALRDDLACYQGELGFPQWHIGEESLPQLAAQINADEWFVVWSHREIVATVRIIYDDPELWPQGGNAGYIHGLMVRRDRMGQGLGSAMLAWAESDIRASDRSLARLDCAMTSLNLRRYYQNRGYLEVGEVHPSTGSPYEPAILLEKSII